MSSAHSTVISMRLPAASGDRLKRMANRYGWTPSDASARLVEEGLRRSEFAFIDFRDSAAGRQACIQGSSLAVWEVILVCQSYKGDFGGYSKAFAVGQSEGAGSRQLRRGVSSRDRAGAGGKPRCGLYGVEAHAAPSRRILPRKIVETLRCSGCFWMSTSLLR